MATKITAQQAKAMKSGGASTGLSGLVGNVVSAVTGAVSAANSNKSSGNNSSVSVSTTPSSSSSNTSTSTTPKTVQAQANGNAPKGTNIGDTVTTQGGTYKVVAANTQGATYNPSSGLWSVKVDSNKTPSATGGSVNYKQVQSNGNAPSDTKVGDIVHTAGGDYKVVAPGTPGATRNPYSGLWSVKVATTGGSTEGYVPLGNYNDKNASNNLKDVVAQGKYLYEYGTKLIKEGKVEEGKRYQALGHNIAEQGRAKEGYSGGDDGSQYIPIQLEEDTLANFGLPSYDAQVDAVNQTYDAGKQKILAALETAFNQSKLEQEAALEKIPSTYQAQMNQIAAQAEKDKANYNEYAAYQGMNTGNGSQAQLAMNNQLQNNLTSARVAQANAETEARQALVALYTKYQDEIKEAIANNEYERAAALLSEYKTAAQSRVDVALDQANLDMSVADFNRTTNNRNYDRALATAQELAQYGIFDGYKALGYSQDEVSNMSRMWKAQNPKTMAWYPYFT